MAINLFDEKINKNDLIVILSKLENLELLEILSEVFEKRTYSFSDSYEDVRRWLIVEHMGALDVKSGRLFPESKEDDVLHVALPINPCYENQDFYESGKCDACGLWVTCTHKLARCPFCYSTVGCT